MEKSEEYFLITTDRFFVAPNGQQYCAVWGKVEIIQDNDLLGIKTNARSSNWYAKVGPEDNYVIIAGCQIHYAIKCNERPSDEPCKTWDLNATDYNEDLTPSKIYFTEPKNQNNEKKAHK